MRGEGEEEEEEDRLLALEELDVMYSLERVELLRQLLGNGEGGEGGEGVVDGLWRVLCEAPIWDASTVYATVMLPASQLYQTRLQPLHKCEAVAEGKGAEEASCASAGVSEQKFSKKPLRRSE